jgi:thiazole synthase ThiGH ThiG subunit
MQKSQFKLNFPLGMMLKRKLILMASAMKHAVIAGRASFLAGRMMKKAYASASSPMENLI